MNKLHFIKLGGGLITDKSVPVSYNQEKVAATAAALKRLIDTHKDDLFLLGNGAGSFGHYVAKRVAYREAPNDPKKVSAVRESVRDLNYRVVRELRKAGLPVVSLPPADFISVNSSGMVTCQIHQVEQLFKSGKVPVVFGDVISSGESSVIYSTEEVFEVIAKSLQTSKLGYALGSCCLITSTPGVLDKAGATLPVVNSSTIITQIKSNHHDVTGAMNQKVKSGISLRNYFNRVVIAGGDEQTVRSLLSAGGNWTELEP